jgi:HAMP domain-containing protein
MNYLKYLKTGFLIMVAVGAVLFYTSYRRNNEKLRNLSSLYDAQSASIEKWKNMSGENLARAKAAEVHARNVNLVLNQELGALKHEVGNLRRNLISYTKIDAHTAGNFTAPLKDTTVVIHNTEEVKAKSFSFSDDYLKFTGTVFSDTLISSYSIRHDFEYYHYYRRPGKRPLNIFRRKEAVAEIKFKNPNTAADSIYTIILKREQSWFRKFVGY